MPRNIPNTITPRSAAAASCTSPLRLPITWRPALSSAAKRSPQKAGAAPTSRRHPESPASFTCRVASLRLRPGCCRAYPSALSSYRRNCIPPLGGCCLIASSAQRCLMHSLKYVSDAVHAGKGLRQLVPTTIRRRLAAARKKLKHSRTMRMAEGGGLIPSSNETAFLHPYRSPVFQFHCRQRPSDSGDRIAGRTQRAVLDDAAAQAVLQRLLCHAGGAGRHGRRGAARGARDVHRQLAQDCRLPADAHGLSSIAVFRSCRIRRRAVFAGENGPYG